VHKYGLHVAPQILIWGEETLADGIDIMPDAFYARLKTATVMPTTSQSRSPTSRISSRSWPGKEADPGSLVSSKLSERSPRRAGQGARPPAEIEIVDSFSTAMALGFQVMRGPGRRGRKSLAQVTEIARRGPAHTGVVFTVETLEFLHRGGRIGGAARLLGTALNLKPVLELVDGRIEPVERVRTKAKARARVLEIVSERVKASRICAFRPSMLRRRWRRPTARGGQPPVEADRGVPSVASPVVGNHAARGPLAWPTPPTSSTSSAGSEQPGRGAIPAPML